jgi:hypothetical protein
MFELKNLAKFKRYLLEKTGLLVVEGCIKPVIAGMDAYNARHKITPPNEDLNPTIQELLAAAALAAVSLSERESWGWSFTLKGMNCGFFVGVEPEGMICMRVLEAEDEKASGVIQRQKKGLPLSQSHITPQTQSPRAAVEQYFSEADQTKTRLAIKPDGEGVLVHALPNGNFDDVKNLNTYELLEYIQNALAAGHAKELGEVLVFYECRCSDEMISRMIAGMNVIDRMDIFGDQQQLEIECPRCGRKYSVSNPEESIH